MSPMKLPVPRLQYRWESIPIEEVPRNPMPDAAFAYRCNQEYVIPTPSCEVNASIEKIVLVETSYHVESAGRGPGYGLSLVTGNVIRTPPLPRYQYLEPASFGDAPMYAIGPDGMTWRWSPGDDCWWESFGEDDPELHEDASATAVMQMQLLPDLHLVKNLLGT